MAVSGNGVTVVVDGQNKTQGAFAEVVKGEKAMGDAASVAEKQLREAERALEASETKARKLALAEELAAAKTRDMAEKLSGLKRQLAESGDESGQLGRKIDRLTTEMRVAANATDDYRRSANRAAGEAREQARAYDRVADNARQAARAVAMLGAAAALTSNGKGGRGLGLGADISAGFLKGGIGGASSAIEGTLGTPVVGPLALAAGAAAAIPAASFAGGVAGGAVGLGLGAGAAGAGLGGAWMGDPTKFSKQWNDAIDNVQHRWLKSSTAAFSKPLEDSLKEVNRLARDIPVERILAISAPFVEPLAQGVGGGLTAAIDGAADALDKMQPIMDEIGPDLANLGADVGDAFRIMSEGSEGGADALGDLTDAIGYSIKAVAILILGFESAYEKIHNFATASHDFIEGIPVVGSFAEGLKDSLFGIGSTSIVAGRALSDTTSIAGGMAESWGDMATEAARATLETLGLNDALTEHRNLALSMADADLAVGQGWFDLNKELKEGKKSLDGATEAGLDNQKAILTQVELLERQRLQAIETGGGTVEAVDAANAAYNASIEKLKQAAIAAGFNATQVDILLASLGALPPNTTTSVTVNGLPTAVAQGISLGNALNRIDGQVYEANVYVNYHQRGQALNAPLRTGGIGHAAGGGAQSGLTMVGEEGPEFVRLPTGSMVYPHANTMQMMAQGGGGDGATAVRVEFSGDTDSEMARWFMRAQRHGMIKVSAG